MTSAERSSIPPSRASRREMAIAGFTITMIVIHVTLRFVIGTSSEIAGLALYQFPLVTALVVGGVLLLFELVVKLLHGEFGLDLLAGISIVTAAILGEYLAG